MKVHLHQQEKGPFPNMHMGAIWPGSGLANLERVSLMTMNEFFITRVGWVGGGIQADVGGLKRIKK